MKILLSGGEKSINIVKAIEKKFEASGDEIKIVKFIDEIESIFEQGDYFDKALICEQSITADGAITDESTIRARINTFAINSSNRNRNRESYVFLTKDENLAEMISDETFPISESSAIVFKEPPYSVQFFTNILIQDARKISAELIYKPKEVVSGIETVNTGDVQTNNMEEQPNFNAMSAPENFETAMLGAGVAAEQFAGYGLDTSQQQNDMMNNNPMMNNMPMDNQQMFDNGMMQQNIQPDMNNMQQNNQLAGFDDYSDDSQQMGNMGFDNSQLDNQGGNDYLPGFDEDDYSNNGGDNELYNGYTQDVSGGSIPNFDSSTLGFDESDYANSEYNNPNTQMGVQQGQNLPGFDDDIYNDNQNAGYNNVQQNNYNNMQQPQMQGFNHGDYDAQNAMAAAAGMAMAGMVANNARNNRRNAQQQQMQGMNNANNTNRAPAISNSMGGRVSVNKVKDALKPFAARGSSIVVTGCGGCGTSTIAYSLANIISLLGYTVLLVDMDTKGRAQTYISRLCYDSMPTDGANLMAAVNSSTGIGGQVTVVKQGFHLLAMGMEADVAPVDELLHKEKLNRFTNLAKTNHNFVIYDIPFGDATNFLADVTYTADSLVLAVDASNWGVAKTMLSVCNIASEDMQDVVFKRAQVVFNRYRNMNRVFGHKVKSGNDILKAMDKQVLELVGDDIGFYFENMRISGIVNDDPNIENGWFEEAHYSDTKKGQSIFLELLYNIVMNK